MANRAYLVCGEDERPACSYSEELGYDPDTEVLCASSTLLPVFWLTLFDPREITLVAREEVSIPAPVTPLSEAKRRLLTSESLVLQRFESFHSEWTAFRSLIADAPGSFLKVDCAQVWDLDPPQFSRLLPSALSFWSSAKKEDWRAVLALAQVTDKSFFRGYSFLPDNTPAAQLQGYGWVRAVPWKE